MKGYRDIPGDGGSDVLGQVEAHQARLKRRMAAVRFKVAILSGKGGVGKSTVTANLAVALARAGQTVGVVDADLNGPSMAALLGVRGMRPALREGAVLPAVGPLGVKVLSMDLFLASDETPLTWEGPSQTEAYLWRGSMEVNTLREFLSDVEWGALDFLLLDLPPGTDRIGSVAGLLPDLSGGIVVTIPTALSHLVVRKSIALAREVLKTPLIGLLENMAPGLCPRCGEASGFPGEADSAAVAEAAGIPFLGRVPFDPRLASAADRGLPFLLAHPEAPAAAALEQVATDVLAYVKWRAAEAARGA